MIEFLVGVGVGASLMYMYKCRCDDRRLGKFGNGTQAYVVRMHLEQGKRLSAEYALKNYNIKKLSAVIDLLRKAGVDVKTVETKDGYYYTL